MSHATRGTIYGLLAAGIWGGMYVVSDIILRIVPPFTLLTIRLALGLLVLGLLIAFQWGRQTAPPRTRWLPLIGVGIVGFGISVGAQFVGTDLSTDVNGALITSASPAFILLFAALILREPLQPVRFLAVTLAMIGVIVIIDPRRADFSSATFQGDIALAVAALTWGLYSVLVRAVSRQTDTLFVTAFGFIGGLLLAVPASAAELTTRPVGSLADPLTWLGIAYLGIVSTAGAMWLWNRAFALLDASRASLLFFAQPATTAILSVLFFGRVLTAELLVGGALIVLGVLLTLRPVRQQRKPA